MKRSASGSTESRTTFGSFELLFVERGYREKAVVVDGEHKLVWMKYGIHKRWRIVYSPSSERGFHPTDVKPLLETKAAIRLATEPLLVELLKKLTGMP